MRKISCALCNRTVSSRQFDVPDLATFAIDILGWLMAGTLYMCPECRKKHRVEPK